MTMLNDREIRHECLESTIPMIEPFEEGVKRPGIISYGLSSYGYDARLAPEFKLFTNVNSTVVDPKKFDDRSFIEVNEDSVIIPPNSFVLGRTIEYFRIPRSILTVCLGKSTYARCGLIVNVTPLEPEWEGHVTIEISNTTPLPAKVYAHEGICQFIFLIADSDCETSYADKGGKYQGQTGVNGPKVDLSGAGVWPRAIEEAIARGFAIPYSPAPTVKKAFEIPYARDAYLALAHRKVPRAADGKAWDVTGGP